MVQKISRVFENIDFKGVYPKYKIYNICIIKEKSVGGLLGESLRI